MREVVMVSACRTAIGKFLGQFKDVSARDLAICAGSEAVKRAGIDVKIIDSCVMGQVCTAMQGSLPAKQVSYRIGLSDESNACVVNQNCASGMRALEIAAHDIMVGQSDISLVIGVESMTNDPYLMPKARAGLRMGPGTVEDSMTHDALVDELSGGHMGMTAENVAVKYGITRQECDELAVMSHQRACAAIDAGKFKDEIVPFVLHSRKGDKIIDTDEHPIRNCTIESIASLKPAFKPDGGVITAANASGINDAAAAVILMARDKADELGIKPLAKLVNVCGAGVDPNVMGLGPARAIPKCLKQAGLSFDDIDYYEINEAFSAQFIGCERMLKEECGYELSRDKVNHNGSGIALGHPIGCTALRIIVSLIYEMKHENYKRGVASLCVGGGPAMASIWEIE